MTSELSGVDLARQALFAAREAARKNGGRRQEKPKRRTGPVVGREGREPLGLGAAITLMMTERGLAAPAAGGSVLAQWDDILAAAAPELAGHVQAVTFDADSGRLDVVPDSPAYGTKLRWSAPKLVAAVNEKVRDANVRALQVLPPAPGKAGPATAADPQPQSAAPAGPVKTRETASAGYRQALAALQGADRKPTSLDQQIRAAAEQQMRSAAREPEDLFGDGQAAMAALRERAERRESVSPADVSRARALQRLAAERAGLPTLTPPQRVDQPSTHQTA